MQRAFVIAIVVAATAGAAHAGIYEDTNFVQGKSFVAGGAVDWMPYGTHLYSGNLGEGIFDADTAYGGTAWLGWEMTDGFDMGVQARYIGHEQLTGDTVAGSELITALRIAAHSRPWQRLDLAFVLAPGYSHVFLPANINLPDSSGFTVDFAVEASYPVGGGWWGVMTVGYQRGFQETTEPSQIPTDKMKPVPTDWATDYLHFGGGLAYRF
jgi:hypothetical protein